MYARLLRKNIFLCNRNAPKNFLQFILEKEQLDLFTYFGLVGEYCSLHRRLFGTYQVGREQNSFKPIHNCIETPFLRGSS